MSRHLLAQRSLGAGVVAVLLMGLGAAPVGAQAEEPELTVTVQEPARSGLPYRLSAQLTAPDGRPVNGADVRFGIHTELFGGRTAHLGTAETDSTGRARLNIEPRQETFQVEAAFPGDESHPATSTVEPVQFPPEAVVAGGLTHETHSRLAPVQELMPPVISGVVVLVWVLLISLGGLTVARIRRAATTADAPAHVRTEV